MAVLVPCEGCRRHIKSDHEACPFCGASVPEGFEKRAVPAARKRLDRLATFTFATTLAVAACGGVTDGGDVDDGVDTPDAARSKDAAPDWGTVQAAYGAAIIDASVVDSSTTKKDGGATDGSVEDDGSTMVMYGIPIPDGGFADVNVQPPYGLPPLDSGSD